MRTSRRELPLEDSSANLQDISVTSYPHTITAELIKY